MKKERARIISILSLRVVCVCGIAYAIQDGNRVVAYDEKKHHMFMKFGELYGYTSKTLSVRQGDKVYVYDVKGHQIPMHYCR